MGIKILLFTAIVIFGLQQIPIAYAMYEDEKTVSILKRINTKISNKTKTSEVLNVLAEDGAEAAYQSLSTKDKQGVHVNLGGELSHIAEIMINYFILLAPTGEPMTLKEAVQEAGFNE